MPVDPAADPHAAANAVSGSDTTLPRRPATGPIAEPKSGARILMRLLTFALAGLWIGLRTVAHTTLGHIVSTAQGVDYQNVTDGNPIPHLLDWNQTQIDALIGLRDLKGPTLGIAVFLLGSILALAALRLLNPGFRLFRVIPPRACDVPRDAMAAVSASPAAASAPSHPAVTRPDPMAEADVSAPVAATALSGAIEPVGLLKIAIILLLIGLPVALCWLVTNRWDAPLSYTIETDAAAGRWGWIWAVRLPILFAALWAGFHPHGLAGNAEERSLNIEPSALPRIALQGAVIGVLAFLIGRYAVPGALEPALLRYQTLGAFNVIYWHRIAGSYLLCMTTAWFAAGALFLLASTSRPAGRRALTALAALGLAIGAPFQQLPGRKWQETHYQITPPALKSILAPYAPDRNGTGVPDGSQAAALLASRLFRRSEPKIQPPDRSVVLFRDDSFAPTGRAGMHSFITTVIQNGITADGLPATQVSADRAVEFLRRNRFQSALSWVATKQRFDVAALHFDTTAALTACLDDLTYGPHPSVRNPIARYFRHPQLQIEEAVQTLFCICAATPANLALLRRWADTDTFAFPDRQSQRLIGDLFRRFGDVDDALSWYRRAEMPRTFLARIRAEQPLFHTGHVEGVLRLNGRALAGVQIGLVPRRLNGLPHGLEGSVNGAIDEIDADRPSGPGFDGFHPLPAAFRWVSGSGVTDTNGRFAIDGLTEGEYVLICTLPASVHLTVPLDRKLHVTNAPLPFILLYGTPKVNLGIIDMDIH